MKPYSCDAVQSSWLWSSWYNHREERFPNRKCHATTHFAQMQTVQLNGKEKQVVFFILVNTNQQTDVNKLTLEKQQSCTEILSCRNILWMELLFFVPIYTWTRSAANVRHHCNGKSWNGVPWTFTFPIHIL